MNKKIILYFFIIVFVFSNICCVFAKGDGSNNVCVSKILYYGDYAIKENREYMLKEEGVKLPLLLETWPPVEYYTAPDLIIVKAEIINKENKPVNNFVLDIELKYKSGKIILDSKGNTDSEKSKKNTQWLKSFMKKSISINEMASRSKKIITVTNFNLKADMNEYAKKNERPWFCETKITIKNKSISKVLPIGVMEEE